MVLPAWFVAEEERAVVENALRQLFEERLDSGGELAATLETLWGPVAEIREVHRLI